MNVIGTRESRDPVCWVVSDGKAGIEIQGRGLAKALGFEPVVKRLKIRAPWRWLPPALWRDPLRSLDSSGDALAPPWPDVTIGTGRLSVGPNLALRRVGRGRTFTIQIQDPKVALDRFDVIVAPAHDRLTGPNVIETRGSLHGITHRDLAEAAARIGPRVAHLPRPLTTVLIGGNSRVHRMTPAIARDLAEQLRTLALDRGTGLLVTPSRRTDTRTLEILREVLAGVPAEIWGGNGDNPYLGYLALADAFVVTGDSVNMICEAAFTGKPIHTIPLAGGTAKFARFHESMRAAGVTRPFAGTLEHWTYTPMNETVEVAAKLKPLIAARLDARAALQTAG